MSDNKPMISDEAVEAAARWLWDRDNYHFFDREQRPSWDEATGLTARSETVDAYRQDARELFAAAAPYMHDKAAETRLLAIAWTEAYQAGFQEGAGFGPTTNPYRSQA